ncbi:MAG: hypothetical protein LIP02_07095 [Bacteroidales bacterium]|nr:hypothetical protein [Bacteroidales bacterium]
MNKKIILAALALLLASPIGAQKTKKIDTDYRRSSIYSLMVSHPKEKYAKEIEDVFLEIPNPDAYNDHDLAIKILSTEEKIKKDDHNTGADPAIDQWLENNKIASRLVAQWWQRDWNTGEMSSQKVEESGILANCTNAEMLARGAASLKGADRTLRESGADLIGNTFVLVNDITYYDRAKKGRAWGMALKIAGAALSAVNSDLGNSLSSFGDIAETYKGFKVKVNTALYQLVYDDAADNLAMDTWGDKEAFESARSRFKLRYVGSQYSDGGTTSFMGIREDMPEVMIRKACQRALDENVANLAKNFQAFQIKTPLTSVEPLEASIGRKEGVDEKSVFEVLREVQDENGLPKGYEKVGEVVPVNNLIWDNRYMAAEELAPGANLGATTFKKKSGNTDDFAGCLLRQIK